MDRFLLGSARRLHRVRNQSPGFRAATFARGFSIPVAILDEVAFSGLRASTWTGKVIDAIRRAQAAFPRAKLMKTSSRYAKAIDIILD